MHTLPRQVGVLVGEAENRRSRLDIFLLAGKLPFLRFERSLLWAVAKSTLIPFTIGAILRVGYVIRNELEFVG